MPSPTPPDDVRRLLSERSAAREARDWARADALRDEIAALGWEVMDADRGSTVRPTTASAAEHHDAVDHLGRPASVEVSFQVVAEDHPEDLERFVRGLAAHRPPMTSELVVVDNAAGVDLESLLAPAWPAAVVLRSGERLGWADSRTLGLRASRGEITVLVDTSVEPIGDFASPLLASFETPDVGLAGPWGVTGPNGRQFEEAPPGEVDAIEAYCMAVRREALRQVGGFDRRFRFYRNADLDLSFAIRAAGWRALRTDPLPLRRHEHRGYASLPEAERERLSRRNFYRFLDHWGDRRDLLLHPDPPRTPERAGG